MGVVCGFEKPSEDLIRDLVRKKLRSDVTPFVNPPVDAAAFRRRERVCFAGLGHRVHPTAPSLRQAVTM